MAMKQMAQSQNDEILQRLKPAIYILYSQDDAEWKDRLLSYLRRYQHSGELGSFEYGTEVPLSDWVQKETALVKIVILLVSNHFLNSDFIWNRDVPILLEYQEQNPLIIMPLLVSRSNWEPVSWLAQLPIRPLNRLPLSEIDAVALDEELSAFASEIAHLSGNLPTNSAQSVEQTAPVIRPVKNRADTLPLEKWEEYDFSSTAHEVMEQAIALASSEDGQVELSASFLLFAMADIGMTQVSTSPPTLSYDTAGFLLQALSNSPDISFQEVRKRYLERKGVLLPPPSPRVPERMTAYVGVALEEASHLAKLTEGNPQIHARHLLAQLLRELPGSENSGVADRLKELRIRPSQLRADFLDFLKRMNLLDRSPTVRQAWEEVLLGEIGQFRQLFDYRADAARGERDLIGIDREVNALATLIAARSVTPPLSFGLFGEWGSGKTFFMRRLRQAVRGLAVQAQNSNRLQKDSPFYKRIVQIEFNAWHYVEGNLWASLVEHIFDNLQVAGEEEKTISETLKQHLIDQLNLEKKAEQQASDEQQAAQNAVTDAQEELKKAKRAYEEKAKELAEVSAANLLKDFPLDDLQPAVNHLLTELGLAEAGKAAKELEAALHQARAVVERGSSVLTPLLQARDRGRRFLRLLMVLVVAPAVSYLFSQIPGWLGKENLSNLSAFYGGAATFLTWVANWLRQQAKWTAERVEQIEKIQADYDQEISEKLAENTRRITQLEQELQVLNADYLAAQRRREAAQQRVAAAEAEVNKATVTNLLAAFIHDRAASNIYSQHLGVLALIRNDFEKLSELMEEENWRLAPPHPDDEKVRWKSKKFATLEEEEKEKERRINRIVLYIDDLDRCPPNKVVDVLQAVHLLLAFPLFVVVVGVDARWITRSLEARYRELMNQRNGSSVDSEDESLSTLKQIYGAATPNDYLEKIFQIPLWLKPLDPTATQRMLKGLLKESLVTEASLQSGLEPAANSPEILSAESLQATAPESPAPLANQPSQPPGASDNLLTTTGTLPIAPADAANAQSPIHPQPSPVSLRPSTASVDDQHIINPESLKIEQVEMAFIEELTPLLSRSPRALKRFINVYQLIKAGLSPQEQRFFLRRVAALSDFQAVLFVLAVDTGLPEISPIFFRTLTQGARATATSSEEEAVHSVARVAYDLDWLIAELNARFEPADTIRQREHEDWLRLRGWIKPPDQEPKLTNDLAQLAGWERRVRRYSFRAP